MSDTHVILRDKFDPFLQLEVGTGIHGIKFTIADTHTQELWKVWVKEEDIQNLCAMLQLLVHRVGG